MTNIIDPHSALELANDYKERLENRKDDVARLILSGNFEDIELYRERIGTLRGLEWAIQELRETVIDRIKNQMDESES